MWRRQRGELTYTSLCYHKLTPPPSRLSSNAAINLLSAAACLWRPAAVTTLRRGVHTTYCKCVSSHNSNLLHRQRNLFRLM